MQEVEKEIEQIYQNSQESKAPSSAAVSYADSLADKQAKWQMEVGTVDYTVDEIVKFYNLKGYVKSAVLVYKDEDEAVIRVELNDDFLHRSISYHRDVISGFSRWQNHIKPTDVKKVTLTFSFKGVLNSAE